MKRLLEDRLVIRLVIGFALIQLLGAAWDLPSSHGWENDGVAPRDLFGGIAINLTPGQGHRYPLFHYLLLALFSLPVLLPAALGAESFTVAGLKAAVLTTPTMTGVSIVAKLTTIGMACITVLVIARITRRLFDSLAGRYAAAALVVCLSFSLYGRTSNLDVPYLMWTVLALDRLLDVLDTGAWRDYAWFAAFAGAAVATKDQAYAAFVLVGLLYLVVWPLLSGPKPERHWARLGGAVLVGVATLAVLGGGLFNPSGFLVRLDMLTGTNSQDWRLYERSLSGLGANLADLWVRQADAWWPAPVVLGAWAGVALAVRRGPRAMLPFVAALSCMLFFVLVAARSEERFMLPLGVLLTPYIGYAAARLPGRPWAHAALACLFLWSAVPCARLLLTQWGDARKQVEVYLERLPDGSVVETYGLLVYQPRFTVGGNYEVRRIDASDPAGRNPLVGADEQRGEYSAYLERGADVLVIPEGFANRYLTGQKPDPGGFFERAFDDRLPGYRRAMLADASLPFGLEPVRIHSTSGVRVLVMERVR